MRDMLVFCNKGLDLYRPVCLKGYENLSLDNENGHLIRRAMEWSGLAFRVMRSPVIVVYDVIFVVVGPRPLSMQCQVLALDAWESKANAVKARALWK